ncbi:Flagellar basal-body rod protein FlgG [bioreactor metagenome]|uniref:Flagellar basal-body rod protein FlgG n=1 Tax=bioreactor metagenome TaxID=1076179 RepID=A0A644XNQ5_9ZZZZ
MVRGLYTAATGMMVQRNKMDVLTNNLVNAETAGFKRDTLVTSSFDQVMLSRIHDPNVSMYGGNPVGPYSFGTHIDELITSYLPGVMETTSQSTDLALVGDGFFAVETPAGERYTRGGSFSVDGEGYLVNQDGYYLLGQNGRVRVGSTDFLVGLDGAVSGSMANPDVLRVVSFEDTASLRKEGNNLYYAYGDAAPAAAEDVIVRQGMLEGSNVQLADEMVNLLTVYRKYEASQKIVSMTDQTLGMATAMGKVGG